MNKETLIAKIVVISSLSFFALSFAEVIDREPGKEADRTSHFGVQAGLPTFANEMKKAGIEIVREWINWTETEPIEDQYNWAEMDRRVQAGNQAGIEILGFFYHMPDWAKMPMKSKIPKKLKASDFCEPKDINDFREFARDVARRYDGKHGHGEMKYIEILNEVTMPEFFDIKNPNNPYEIWLINGYKGVKEGNPNAKVLIGGFVHPLGAKDFVDRMLRDYNRYYDIVNFHTYKLETEVTEATEYLKARMQFYNVNKPVWLTETAAVFPLGDRMDLQDRTANAVVKRYVRAFGGGVEKVFWYTFVGLPTLDENPTYGVETKTIGLGWDFPKGTKVARAFHPRQAYKTYRLMTSKLSRFTKVEKIQDTQYKFIFANKKPIYVLWVLKGEDYSLPKEITGNVKVTDYLGNEETKQASSIVLSEGPIFVE